MTLIIIFRYLKSKKGMLATRWQRN
jgi:hypothetical protein